MSDGFLEEFHNRKLELEKLKKQVQTEKLEYNKWLREDARDELFIEKISEAIKNNPLPSYPVENTIASTALDGIDDKAYILAFGDAHFGSCFKLYNLNNEIINEYSPEVYYDRMERLLQYTIDYIEKEGINHLYVFDMGDSIDGMLRVSQLMKLRYGVVDSTVRYAQYLADWLNRLSVYVPVTFQMCNGNHSELRMLGQPKGSFEFDNMGHVIYSIINIYLEDNDRITCKQNKTGMIYEKIMDMNIVGFHGESKNLEATLKDFSHIYDINIDILIAGHLHYTFNENIGIGKDVVRTPSIIGLDDYSLKLSKISNPGATLMTLQQNKGKIIDYHIKL